MAGVTDWSKKLAAIKLLLNVNGDKELCDRVKPDSARPNFYDNLRKWDRSIPKNPATRSFFDKVAKELKCKSMNGERLISCSYDQFLASLSSDQRRFLAGSELATTERLIVKSTRYDPWDRDDTWIRDQYVDLKSAYLNIDSVENWRALLTSDEAYRTHKYCMSSITSLLTSEAWSAEKRRGLDTLVICGAGTPEKELLLISDLLQSGGYSSQKRLRVIIVDTSHYMADYSLNEILKSIKARGQQSLVSITQFEGDFTRLESHDRTIRTDGERIVFAILGGTIGNIDERAFLQSIYSVSGAGDLLLVSAEFVSEAEDSSAYLDALKKNYSGHKAADFVLEPIRRLLDLHGVSGDREERRDLVQEPRINDSPLAGPIPGTVSAELCAEVAGITMRLSQSKRYDLAAFLEFFESARFKCVERVPCAEFRPYCQVLFQRTD